ncbi:MAG: hypothetical protein IT518_05265 [Burkholderiales bacterium]|nr:hypothetical protein [Burkholderiales bacterium]
MNARVAGVALALVGVAAAWFVEYMTPRAAGFEPSFGVFAYNAGPFVLLGVLALFSPYSRALCAAAVAMLALEAFAYYTVFVQTPAPEALLVYLYKPFIGLAIVATAMLAGFLVSRAPWRQA